MSILPAPESNSPLRLFARRWWHARRAGVAFRGMARTRLPAQVRWGNACRPLAVPDGPLFVADFVNVVLDDDYGLRQLVRPPRTIADVGANVGLFACHARALFPDATIHAYEPSPETAGLARANTTHPLTTIFAEGVAHAPGRARMRDFGASNLARTEPDAAGGIALASFAQVVERIGGRIDLLKIDCEGAEWDFVRDPELFAHVGTIRMEYHLVDGRTLDDVRRLAEGIGFTVKRLIANEGFGIAWLDRPGYAG